MIPNENSSIGLWNISVNHQDTLYEHSFNVDNIPYLSSQLEIYDVIGDFDFVANPGETLNINSIINNFSNYDAYNVESYIDRILF